MLQSSPENLSDLGANTLTILSIVLLAFLNNIGLVMGILVAITAMLVNLAKFAKIMKEKNPEGESLWESIKKSFKK